MIIRRIREDENRKICSVSSIAFNYSCDLNEKANDKVTGEIIGAFKDDGETLMAMIHAIDYKANYCGGFLPCVGIAGVASLPEYRRNGCVKAIFNEIFRMAPERGWATSYLYPFSYVYYRQFGYERVMMIKRVKMPMNALDVFPRNNDAVLYQGNEKQLQDILSLYEKYALNYNLTIKRDSLYHNISAVPHKSQLYTYVHYDLNNEADAYATFNINGDCLTVSEIVYINSKSLIAMLGFLRMYDGQVSEIKFTELPLDSDVDYVLKKYIDCEYTIHNGGMCRALQIEPLLKQNKYPLDSGQFSLKVDDYLDYNRYIYDVAYCGGKAEISKRREGSYDVMVKIPSLTRILIGEDNFDGGKLEYLPDVEIVNQIGADALVKAFPKRRLCLFDKF